MPRHAFLASLLALPLLATLPPASVAVAAGPETGAGSAVPATAPASDKLIFAPRDFGGAATAPGLVWRLERSGPPAEGFLPVSDGRLILETVTDPSDGKPMLQMRETGGGRDRVVGRYPAEGMDPVLVYFFETATRNMAVLAHGSADYIRNRFKDAMRRGGTVSPSPGGGGQRVVLTPFADDPNAARMAGFDRLTLTLDIPDTPGAPIRAFAAEAPGYALRLTREETP